MLKLTEIKVFEYVLKSPKYFIVFFITREEKSILQGKINVLTNQLILMYWLMKQYVYVHIIIS